MRTHRTPTPTANPMQAVAHRVAAVVNPLTWLRRVTIMVPAPQETDATDHLRAEPGRVPHPVAGVYKLADQHGGCRSYTQQHMGPQASRPLANPSLKSNGSAKNHRQ